MHDVTEGGILGACWEIADCSGVGIEVYEDKIPVLEETKIICNKLGVDYLRLISSGSMLIVCSNGDEMLSALKKAGIVASIIGKIVEEGKWFISNGEKTVLGEPTSDELYKV